MVTTGNCPAIVRSSNLRNDERTIGWSDAARRVPDQDWKNYVPEGVSRPTLGSLLYEQVDALLADGDLGVQRSDFMRQLAARLVRAWWPSDAGHAPDPRTVLSDAQLVQVIGILSGDRFERALADAAHLCRKAAVGLELQLAVRMPQERPRAFSEQLAVWVGTQLATDAHPDEASIAAFITACIDERLAKGTPLVVDEFVAAYDGLYDATWSSRGTAALADFPPSSIDLGDDIRPPLVRDPDDGEPDDWTRGSNRAVYDRYRFSFRSRRPRIACDRAGCLNTDPPLVEDRAAAEVLRACEPYGLGYPEHQQLLRSVQVGVGAEPKPGRPGWNRRLSPCTPVDLRDTVDEVVVDAMALAVQSWQYGSARALLEDVAGDPASYLHVVTWVIVRRGWTNLLGRETTLRLPARRCWMRSLVSDALRKEATARVWAWIRDGSNGPRLGRREATLLLLGTAPTVTLALRDESPTWRNCYLALVDADAGRKAHLAPADARSMVQQLFRGTGS